MEITILLVIALMFGLYMAWSIGANDVANAMGTSVGSGALTLKQAVIIAAVLEFAGAFLVGSHVSDTVRKGIIDPNMFVDKPDILVYGMMASLLAAASWLQFATYFGWPVSTTHSIVGAIVGFGTIVGGAAAVDWIVVGSIVSSWVISPLLSGVIAFTIFSILRKLIFLSPHPVKQAKRITPLLVFLVFIVLTLVLVFKGLKNLHLDMSFDNAIALSAAIGLVASFIGFLLVRRVSEDDDGEYTEQEIVSPEVISNLKRARKRLRKTEMMANHQVKARISKVIGEIDDLEKQASSKVSHESKIPAYKKVERIFVYLQILSASFVAFAHGANDVANSIGPLAAVVSILKTGSVAMKTSVPLWILGLGGVGIVIGLATWGWRVIETVGKKFTELTPTRGFAAEFAAAVTIILASKLGLPISTTHTLVGAVLGVGLARGIKAINLNTIRDIVISWVITLPAGAILAIGFFYALKGIFG